ncbi:DUF4224 domain-containing protein [Marichromatium gracile]|uniref:DUF4224 domain-containing protein n=1 Tax=Marichromatium gracile TaxID=1048 RepID=UPI0009EEFCA5
MSAFLSEEDIKRMTKRVRPSAQRRALDRMGVRYLTRPDGRPIVARATIEHSVTERSISPEPNWSAL